MTIGRRPERETPPQRAVPRRVLAAAIAAALAAPLALAGCRAVFAPEYEYEEAVELSLDGSATVSVHASVPALVALRGLDLPLDPRARLDRRAVAAVFETPVTRVRSVTLSRRHGRRYVHVRLDVEDVRRLGEAAPFAWAEYRFTRRDGLIVFEQRLGQAAGRDVGEVGWRGGERVAVRLRLPSRVPFHNQPEGTIERGNILVWEQPLAARLRGEPLRIEAHMEPQSILRRTLSLFAAMIGLAALAFAAVVWILRRAGARAAVPARAAAGPPPRSRPG